MASVNEGIAVKIQKLLAASKSPDEHEAALAMVYAQKLMRQYNLDAETIQDTAGTMHDIREKVQVDRSARYDYQQRLYRTLCQVNYCWYSIVNERDYDDPRYNLRIPPPKRRHQILGKRSNVTAVKMLGEYLEDTMSRLSSDMRGSPAISWRNGCTDRLCERLTKQFASTEGVQGAKASDKALILKSVADREYAGNYDHERGDGAWARRLAANAELERQEKEWLEYLANETPEQQATRRKSAERDLRRQNREAERYTGIRDYNRRVTERRKDAKRTGNDFYKAGNSAGASISPKRQVKSSDRKLLK